MDVYHGYRQPGNMLNDPVAAIGMFDGIHLGHKKVIRRVLSHSGSSHERVIITFDPHPQKVLQPDRTPPRIMSLEHRLHIMEKMGVDAVIIIRFTRRLAAMSPEEFVREVLGATGVSIVYVGANFHFGSGKTGDTEGLRRIGAEYGIEVRVVEPVKLGASVISSTWLRKLVRSGNLDKAEKILRRPVSVYGTVVRGEARGRALGYPTANIDPHQEVIPPPGVYAVKVDVDGELFNGVLNIGFKPTFYGSKLKKRKEPLIEAHIMDFKGALYGRNIEIFFVRKIRRERRFKTEQALRQRIDEDRERALKMLTGEKISRKIKRYKYL
ncbi:MAG: bifunctional riboflavin kinase/FAD synthetase [Candidatus Omnitrophica bacterium]|nr:bifunctional riboflavin kinase/FAD synthetase [Candidatus Omnitrophota bacterium]